MKSAVLIPLLILSGAVPVGAFAEEPFHALEGEVLKILRAKYPDAKLEKDKYDSDLHAFSRKMREFVVYRLNKTGDWQRPFNEKGPDRGGLSVRFSVKKGRWQGALVVPYSGTDDLHVFKETAVVMNSADGSWHIWAYVMTPKVDSPDEVLGKLVKLFNDFETYR